MSNNIEKLKKRIKQLLAVAESTTHEHEAESFAEKARILMEEHQLNHADLRDAEDPLEIEEMTVDDNRIVVKAMYSRAAEFYGCSIMFEDENSTQYKLAGRLSNRVTFIMMVEFWSAELRKLVRDFALTHDLGRQEASFQLFLAFTQRIHKLTVKKPLQAATSNLPVPLDEAQRKLEEENTVETRLYRSSASPEAVTAVKNISVDTQMNGDSDGKPAISR